MDDSGKSTRRLYHEQREQLQRHLEATEKLGVGVPLTTVGLLTLFNAQAGVR